jgi:Bacteriophage HK97-gp10, putative tail-component
MSFTMSVTRRIPHGAPLRIRAAIRTWSAEVGPIAEEAIKAEAPVYKGGGSGNHFGGMPGRLRDSIQYRPAGEYGAEISVGVPYAKYVINGTQPHTIAPRNATVLHWVQNNEDHFAYRVDHPGNQANNFPERALRPWGPLFAHRLKELTEEALRV